MKEIHSIVSGHVQIVMYRSFARARAHKLGLKGTVRNLADGTVEVIAQGEEEKLKKFIDELHKGSLFSRVDEVKVTWCEPEAKFSDFEIIL
ncbi:MAG: acylphosphatase [Minisyncoccia bacterium]